MKKISKDTKIPKSYWVSLGQIDNLKYIKKHTHITESALVREGIDDVIIKYMKLLRKK